MNPAFTRPSHAIRRHEDISVLHFKRFLETLSAPVAANFAIGTQPNAKFRVLHVKRTLAEPAVLALAMVGHASR